MLGGKRIDYPYRLTAKMTVPHFCMQGTATKRNSPQAKLRGILAKRINCPDCLCVSTRFFADEPFIAMLHQASRIVVF
jgi:hypothetical protein